MCVCVRVRMSMSKCVCHAAEQAQEQVSSHAAVPLSHLEMSKNRMSTHRRNGRQGHRRPKGSLLNDIKVMCVCGLLVRDTMFRCILEKLTYLYCL